MIFLKFFLSVRSQLKRAEYASVTGEYICGRRYSTVRPTMVHARETFRTVSFNGFCEGSYEITLGASREEVDSALRLRYKVFKGGADAEGLEFDDLDLTCQHLIVTYVQTGEVIGTYRINTRELAGSTLGFYSAREFTIDRLPSHVLDQGIELGRACIAPEHRNSRVLFLMWKGLMSYLTAARKRYFFGCCSIFTHDEAVGRSAYRHLLKDGHIESEYFLEPIADRVDLLEDEAGPLELPNLFALYLKLGAKVCSSPMIDRDFGTIDFFVVLDTAKMPERYKRMLA